MSVLPSRPKYGGYFVERDETEKGTKFEDVNKEMKQLRIASGETHGEAEMPVTCAPLVFPALDAVATAVEGESHDGGVTTSFKSKSKSASKLVADYYDRRAQATYVCPSSARCLSAAFFSPVSCVFEEIKD